MSDYTEKNSNLIPKIDIPCFAWNSQAEQGLLFFKAKSLDIRQYNMVHRYPNREYFFLNTKGKKITSSSALATIQEKLEEVNNINTTTLALKGVSKLIQKGLTLSEIKYLTGFETKKIEDVSRWLMNQEDVESVINNKLNLIDI